MTGNTSIDTLEWAAEHATDFGPGLEALSADVGRRIVLVTAHRRENWGAGLAGVATAIERLSERYPETAFVVPMHPNPIARQPLLDALEGRRNVALVEPRDYFEFVRLMASASLILTDSGGVQEEAPAFGVPVLVARSVTERQEGVEAGTLQLVGTDPERIVSAAEQVLDRTEAEVEAARRSAPENPYGDGTAAHRIVAALAHTLDLAQAPDDLVDDRLGEALQSHLGPAHRVVGAEAAA